MPRSNKFLDRLVAARFRKDKLRKILKDEAEHSRREAIKGPQYLTGTHKGVFYRIKLPVTTSRQLPSIPKLHTPTSPPMRFTQLGGESSTHRVASELILTSALRHQEFWERFSQWLKENYPTLILNFGSICTLIGFTRSDVLELRCLSVTGSVCAMAYHFTSPPLRIPPIIWSSTFAAVNSLKIFEILQERKGSVNLTQEQQERYINFFMPHGVTPKQFEVIHGKAEVLHVKKGTLLIKQHEEFKHVYLVVSGTTRASILGRFVTADSTTPTAHEERVGGDSGAWIGEMSLLERVWIKEQAQHQPKRATAPVQKGADAITSKVNGSKVDKSEVGSKKERSDGITPGMTTAKRKGEDEKTPFQPPTITKPPKLKASRAMTTIVAQEDCTVLRWSHADMEALMERSTDMRAALTRAMTAAIVGKVINFTVSRSSARTTWATWLDDWKYSAGARVQIDDEQAAAAESEEAQQQQQQQESKETLPLYPIKRFK